MPLYVAGQKIRGSEINSLPQIYRTTADQICNNSTVLRNITGLAFQGEALVAYLVECFLMYHAKTANDMVININAPAGMTGWWTGGSNDPAAAGGRIADYDTTVLVDPGFTNMRLAGDDVWHMFARPVCYLQQGATVGTMQFMFAQYSAVVHDTVVKKGSALRVTRLGAY